MSAFTFIPQQYASLLSSHIAKGEFDSAQKIVDQNAIDINAYIDSEDYSTLIIEVLTTYGCKDEEERAEMLRYLLEKGANPNTYCKNGYNALHIAVQQDKLVKCMNLLLDYGGDVNLADPNGGTVAYWAIQGFPWRTEGQERENHLNTIEKIMMLGADLDRKNKFGVDPRKWLEHTSEDVKELVAKCEKRNPVYKPSHTIVPKFPTNYKFPEIVEQLRALIPPTGSAKTIEAEMLRGLDILQDEAYRNGNINYNQQHKDFAQFILLTLTTSTVFDDKEIKTISSNVKKLMSAKKPYLDDDVYDYLTDKICVYYNHQNKKENAKKKWWQIGK
ncbi:ankyrin repeat domain-containing protein [Flavobacterium sp. 17A]|uniref:Ankyrin repeat domain-containing protein n=1 Tax=Flavobacterium potami TaxID=2872310 RepID=A0A9X1H7A3_9FLAO|nr:ankyrin repeat domain-containing protein [Flavobacterium potami]MBZ4033495.1 ankyrin repeat domain-containing protein [Flavobacterium potami]